MASQAGQACKAIGLEFDDKNLKELLREFDTDGEIYISDNLPTSFVRDEIKRVFCRKRSD